MKQQSIAWSKRVLLSRAQMWRERLHQTYFLNADQLVELQKAEAKSLTFRIYNLNQKQATQLQRELGGQIEKIDPQAWLTTSKKPFILKLKPFFYITSALPTDFKSMCSRLPKKRYILPRTHLINSNDDAISRRQPRAGTTCIPNTLGTEHGGNTESAHQGIDEMCSIYIPAGLAFGTGEHATTSMCLRFLTQTHPKPFPSKSIRMLDCGTGSGILAFAGASLGYQVSAFDIDPASIQEARKNARLNRHLPSIDWSVSDLAHFKNSKKAIFTQTYLKHSFDRITANLYADCIIEYAPLFKKLLAKDGLLILSGILKEQADEVIRHLQAVELHLLEKKIRGKWVSLLATQPKIF